MDAEKGKKLAEALKLVSPGTLLRRVIDDLLRAGLGAMIVFDSKGLFGNLTDGGFRINSRFTSQKLFELCKMDGAVIISSDLKRINYANVTMAPDHTILTTETGTRHKAAERVAKQANTLVIAVSERRKKTTIYFGENKYFLKSLDELLRDTNLAVSIIEKQKEKLKENLNNLNVLEMSDLVSTRDVCKVIQKAEMVLKIARSIKINFTELGREGHIMNMRYRELVRGVDKLIEEILRDYSPLSMKKAKKLLSKLTFDGLLDLDSIARLVIEEGLDENISAKGFRFLSYLNISSKDILGIVRKFNGLSEILMAESQDLEPVLRNLSGEACEEIKNLREQILNGKAMF